MLWSKNYKLEEEQKLKSTALGARENEIGKRNYQIDRTSPEHR